MKKIFVTFISIFIFGIFSLYPGENSTNIYKYSESFELSISKSDWKLKGGTRESINHQWYVKLSDDKITFDENNKTHTLMVSFGIDLLTLREVFPIGSRKMSCDYYSKIEFSLDGNARKYETEKIHHLRLDRKSPLDFKNISFDNTINSEEDLNLDDFLIKNIVLQIKTEYGSRNIHYTITFDIFK